MSWGGKKWKSKQARDTETKIKREYQNGTVLPRVTCYMGWTRTPCVESRTNKSHCYHCNAFIFVNIYWNISLSRRTILCFPNGRSWKHTSKSTARMLTWSRLPRTWLPRLVACVFHLLVCCLNLCQFCFVFLKSNMQQLLQYFLLLFFLSTVLHSAPTYRTRVA